MTPFQRLRGERRAGHGDGDVFRLEDVTAFALTDFAHRIGTRPSFLAREMTRMAQANYPPAPRPVSGSSRRIDEHPAGAGRALLLKVARKTLQERLQLGIRAARR
ncbi:MULTISPECIES: hypothetical protein [unclassified Caballeronia]|uniref:hypothetical protein n=1 Tax=unclassified Caballeronia TaxID=2646786 RepID=UPI0019CF85F9|nr:MULTISPECIES: hypothetical protein [unclassified Caballeronia]